MDKFTKILFFSFMALMVGYYYGNEYWKPAKAENLPLLPIAGKRVIPHSEQIYYLVQEIFGDEADIAYAIAQAESGLDCKAVNAHNRNGTVDIGIMQINSVHLKRSDIHLEDLLDCRKNIEFAKRLRDEWGSFRAWSTYNNKKHLKYLN